MERRFIASMRPYELTFIVRPEVEGGDLDVVVDRVKNLVTGGGGQVTEVNAWGRRQLAYPIHKITEGQYFFVRAQLPAHILTGLERDLRLTEQIVRYLIVRADE
jgi:small subunit ribosomal protein S6